jgi:D-cysteine desulfhydrase
VSLVYPAKVDLAVTPTPLQFLPRATARFGQGARLWVKRDDLTGSTLSGNKVRKLEFLIAHARSTGCDTLITCGGLQSNHCRSTALAGAQTGLAVHLLLLGEEPADPDGNLLLDKLAGATVNCYPRRQYVAEIGDLFAHWARFYEAQGRKALCIPTGASDGTGIWGYIAASQELLADFAAAGIDEAHVVTATGSGGTQAGLTLGALLHGLPATVWGVNVCDDEAYFVAKVAQDVAEWAQRYAPQPPVQVETRVIDGYVGDGYGIASPEVFGTIRELAALEGIVLDPVYTGKAFHGMIREIAAGRFADRRDIVFLHTGGIYGVFPQRAGFKPWP